MTSANGLWLKHKYSAFLFSSWTWFLKSESSNHYCCLLKISLFWDFLFIMFFNGFFLLSSDPSFYMVYCYCLLLGFKPTTKVRDLDCKSSTFTLGPGGFTHSKTLWNQFLISLGDTFKRRSRLTNLTQALPICKVPNPEISGHVSCSQVTIRMAVQIRLTSDPRDWHCVLFVK